jgi:hypothetical protein
VRAESRIRKRGGLVRDGKQVALQLTNGASGIIWGVGLQSQDQAQKCLCWREGQELRTSVYGGAEEILT